MGGWMERRRRVSTAMQKKGDAFCLDESTHERTHSAKKEKDKAQDREGKVFIGSL